MKPQGPIVYRASVKTFWPGYEKGDTESIYEAINRDFKTEFASVEEQQAEVTRIQQSAYAKEHWPKFAATKVLVREAPPWDTPFTETEWTSKGDRPIQTVLYFPNDPSGRARAVLLHELAHAVDDWEFGVKRDWFSEDDGHGPVFAKLNIDMIRQFHSPELADKLEANFRTAGIEIAA